MTNILIPGGELSLQPAAPYTDKKGIQRQGAPKVIISFGKQFIMVRPDLYRSLVNKTLEDSPEGEEIRRFTGVKID